MNVLEAQKVLDRARETKRVILDPTPPRFKRGLRGKYFEPDPETKPDDWVCPDCGLTRVPFWDTARGGWTLYQGPCETCQARDFTEETMRLIWQRTLQNNGLAGGEYGRMTFQSYVPDPKYPSQELAKQAVIAMVERWREGDWKASILLASTIRDVGIGKTHLAIAAARAGLYLWKEPGYKILTVWDMPSYVAAIKESYDNGGTAEIQASAAEPRILVMDDVGAEHVVSMGWYQSLMYDIFNARWLDELATVVTTNLSSGELLDRLGSRAASRMFALTGKPIIMKGADYRLKDMK